MFFEKEKLTRKQKNTRLELVFFSIRKPVKLF
nr:MAG TPA: hypothetical protein [Caudoviricetes sp.]